MKKMETYRTRDAGSQRHNVLAREGTAADLQAGTIGSVGDFLVSHTFRVEGGPDEWAPPAWWLRGQFLETYEPGEHELPTAEELAAANTPVELPSHEQLAALFVSFAHRVEKLLADLGVDVDKLTGRVDTLDRRAADQDAAMEKALLEGKLPDADRRSDAPGTSSSSPAAAEVIYSKDEEKIYPEPDASKSKRGK